MQRAVYVVCYLCLFVMRECIECVIEWWCPVCYVFLVCCVEECFEERDVFVAYVSGECMFADFFVMIL